ncbi:hypothetical protein QS257_01745 [Terrilactibacillus sp. S3-3]|nr:hypothetical protein QS257_01745 [Terrilactibacillus sp. S3-3]
MTSQIIVNELIEDDKEIVRRLLIESYRQYEPDYTDPQIWKNYLAEITASVDNPRGQNSRCENRSENSWHVAVVSFI